VSLVVDASVALKWVVDEPGASEANALLQERLVAPELLLLECANGLWRRVRKGELTQSEAEWRFGLLEAVPKRLSPDARDTSAALRLAIQLGHPIYDCLYLACAIRNGCQVVTADKRFLLAVAGHAELSRHVRLLT